MELVHTGMVSLMNKYPHKRTYEHRPQSMQEILTQLTEEELDAFIRLRLGRFEPNTKLHKKINFGGDTYDNYASDHNIAILNLFEDCGIYGNKTINLVRLLSYKGSIYFHYVKGYSVFEEMIDYTTIELTGCGTVQIIKEIFKILELR